MNTLTERHQGQDERDRGGRSYLREHEAFRNCSNQREQISDWIERLGLLERGGTVPSVLSVGAGGGDIDCELVRVLGRRGAFAYDVVEPSGQALARFDERCNELDPTAARRVWMQEGRFEDFEPGHHYDLIHFIHVVYALSDLRGAMSKAYRMLTERGMMAIVCSTDEGMNAFKRAVSGQIHVPGLAVKAGETDLLVALSELEGGALELELIPSQISVEGCFEGTPEGCSVLNFFLQTDFGSLGSAEREAVLAVLAEHCEERDGERVLSQPMLGITVEKNAPATPRRVALTVPERRSLGSLADVACFS